MISTLSEAAVALGRLVELSILGKATILLVIGLTVVMLSKRAGVRATSAARRDAGRCVSPAADRIGRAGGDHRRSGFSNRRIHRLKTGRAVSYSDRSHWRQLSESSDRERPLVTPFVADNNPHSVARRSIAVARAVRC